MSVSNDIELATNQELIQELMKRTTFAGVIICSESEQRMPTQVHESFRLYTTGDNETTETMLGIALNCIKES